MSGNRARASIGAWGATLAISLVIVGCGGGADQESAPPGPAEEVADCGTLAGSIEQIECYVDRATLSGHPRICQQAEQEGVRYQCLAILAGRLKDASICDDIPSSSDETRALRDKCLSDVAAVLEESTLCGRILTAGLRDSCYFKIAGATGDSSLCDRIDDPGLKSGCTGIPVVVD
jgi:hypothetical protein